MVVDVSVIGLNEFVDVVNLWIVEPDCGSVFDVLVEDDDVDVITLEEDPGWEVFDEYVVDVTSLVEDWFEFGGDEVMILVEDCDPVPCDDDVDVVVILAGDWLEVDDAVEVITLVEDWLPPAGDDVDVITLADDWFELSGEDVDEITLVEDWVKLIGEDVEEMTLVEDWFELSGEDVDVMTLVDDPDWLLLELLLLFKVDVVLNDEDWDEFKTFEFDDVPAVPDLVIDVDDETLEICDLAGEADVEDVVVERAENEIARLDVVLFVE